MAIFLGSFRANLQRAWDIIFHKKNYHILVSFFAILNDFNKAAEEYVESQELEHGRSSEMLLLSSGVSENCGPESKHETELITWPLFLLWALLVELTVSVQPK